MIHLLPIRLVLLGIVVSYAVIIVIIVRFMPDNSLSESVYVALSGATILNVIILIFLSFGWKWLWGMFPSLGKLIFPDLNGRWGISIDWMEGEKNGQATGSAEISMNFYTISMVVNTKDSDSETLYVHPSKNGTGCPTLHYFYHVTPKRRKEKNKKRYEEYKGSAILTMSSNSPFILSGNYFTDRATTGHFTLKRKS